MYINPISSSIYNINFTAKKALYLVSKQGECKRYESRGELAQELNCSTPVITNAMCRKKSSLKEGYVINAQDIEKTDENGNPEVDNDKLTNKINFLTMDSALYTFDLYTGTYKRYVNQTTASKELNIKDTNVSACLKGKLSRSKNYAFVKAKDIEEVDKEGTVRINKEKLIRMLNSSLKASPAIYSIAQDGSYVKYLNEKEAAQALGVSSAHVSTCVNYGFFAKSHRLMKACEVEYIDSNGKLVTDTKRIKDIAKKQF